MSRIITGKIAAPKKVIIYGPEGIGKTSLAAAFPGSLLIDVESGSGDLDCRRIIPEDWKDLLGLLDELYNEADSTYADVTTLVIDTVDWVEHLISVAVCEAAEVSGIEYIGYGKGYTYIAEDMMLALAKLDMLRNIGMNIVFVAHSQIQKRELPGNVGAFDRYELKCGKKVTDLIKEWGDAVLFMNYKIDVEKGADGKVRAHGGTERMLMTQHTAAFDAKNRWGLEPELFVGPVDDPVPAEILAQMATRSGKKKPAKSQASKDEKQDEPTLKQLMKDNEISEDDLKAVLAKQGIKKLTKDVESKLVSQFDKVVKLAKALREAK